VVYLILVITILILPMRATKAIPFKGKKKYAVLVDGECEFWYFQMIKRNKRDLQIDLKPEIPQKKKLGDQYKKVCEYAKDYDKVIWILDLDVISDETRKVKKGAKTAMQEFKEYHNALEKHKNVMVIVNNPCLEFWFLLHFEATSKFFNDCKGAAKKLNKYLIGYEKTETYYTKKDNDIFLKLEPYLKTAIANAGKFNKFSFDNTQTGLAEMHTLFELEELKSITDKNDLKIK